MDKFDAVVIGAGVVGLAVARRLAQRGFQTLLLEAGRAIGTGISSRSSEVIHAGLHGEPSSLKAQLCVRGRQLLYPYCAERGVPHARCGKWVVATAGDTEDALERLLCAGRANGVDDLSLLSGAQARNLEPQLACVAALDSPGSGIVDSHALMLALLGDFESVGGLLALGSPVLGGAADAAGLRLEVGGAEPCTVAAACVVNATGLHAPSLAGRFDGHRAGSIPRSFLAKGSYFGLRGRPPFSRLIYLLPQPGGLGVHLTLDLAGRARFGPDVEWVDAPDYRVDEGRGPAFEAAIRRYWPQLPAAALVPDYAGVRPKLSGPGAAPADFQIQRADEHGLPGLIHLFGIESPGLTACLALAERVVEGV